MSKRNKLGKFSDILSFPNVYENFDIENDELLGENGKPVFLKGKWQDLHFQNANDIVLELACGRGEYTLGLSKLFPELNFIGVDIKGARIWKGAKQAIEDDLKNAAFLRTRIEMITRFLDKDEVSKIWITFPDPFIRKSKANRRLTSPNFINAYRKFLKPGGTVNLKTDAPSLYEYTLEVIEADPAIKLIYHSDDIYADKLYTPELELKTYYERMHLQANKTIKFIQFTI